MTKLAHPQKQNNYKLLAVAIAAAISTNTTFAAEAETEEHRDLNMIEIKGQATGGIDRLITTEELEKIQANDLADIFRLDPQINASGSVGMGQKIYLRNIGEDALNISVDGAEQAGAIFHHSGRVAVEPDLLKQVEVEAGSGSATVGPGALGGSVRFVTKDPSDLLEPGETAGALIKGTYYSNTEGYKSSTSVFSRDESDIVSVLASFVRSEHDDAEDGNGDEIIGSESSQKMSYVKLVTKFSDEQKLSVSYEKLKEEGDILYKPELIAAPGNLPAKTEGWRDTAILNYEFDSINNDLLDLSINLYKTDLEQERFSVKGSQYPNGKVETHGATIQNTSLVANHKLIYGINYRDDESSYTEATTSTANKETGKVKGVYIQDVIAVTDAFTVSTGVRFDDYELIDINDQKITSDGFSPNISANFDITSEWSVSAGYAEALRGAEVKDALKLYSSRISNDPDLQAENSKNYEVGIDFSRGGFSFAAGVYKSVIENAISGEFPWSKLSENLDEDIETVGYFVQADYVWDRLTAMVSFNSADTEVDDVTAIRYVYGSTAASKGDTLVTDISYEFTQDFMMGWTAEFVKGIHDIDIELNDDAKPTPQPLKPSKPGYGVHDIYARWLPTSNEDFSLTFTVKNLFDKQYLDHSSVEDLTSGTGYEAISGSPEAGRDFRLTAALRI
ncbi:TonB-dependent receptor domain-containing protein [Litoribacillus peritrichatus]|uniref:TonB-dependent siderophore receptor n=1 Tax=Litoribacillus peritrichatus TaxID=718191 RepID=A0ABP7MJ46_9GAMM